MSEPQTILIVGAGQAGGCAAATLRQEGFAGRIVLVGAEAHRPYERPPLSKSVLQDPCTEEGIFLHKQDLHDSFNLEYLPGVKVTRLDAAARLAHTADGGQIPFDRCLLSTGGRARLWPGVPEGAPHVYYLRELDDARRLRQRMQPGSRAVVIGGGFLGLEFAGVAREKGMEVTVLEAGPTLLGRAAPPLFAHWLEQRFRAAGIAVHCSAQVDRLTASATEARLDLSNGQVIQADFALVSIGQIPNVELAQHSGIAIDNGIAVDEQGQTSAHGIYAAGDCASHASAWLQRRVRLESWQNAQEQAIVAAKSMLGKPASYNVVPWFWSDQLGLNLQMLGLPEADLQYVVRGDMTTEKFSIYGMRGDQLRYVLAVNSGAEIRPLRNLLESGRPADARMLTDAARPIRDIVKQALA